MNTLVIHPFDKSTTFLEVIYQTTPNKTVITGGISKNEVKKLIEEHDRVMMMGHGSPNGLFNINQFKDCYNGYIIDNEMVNLLSKKDNNVYIWCNADKFVDQHWLKGFYSGMFISEVGEANYCGLFGTKQDIVDESNYGFSNILAEYIDEEKSEMYKKLMLEYGTLAIQNPVALYNYNRLYLA
jgi:hypothetical protein